MINVYSDVVQWTGTHYDFGLMQGKLLKQSPILPNRRKSWSSKYDRYFIINEQEFRNVIEKFAPKIWGEINGLADALKMKLSDAIREFGGYYIEYGQSGCSIFTNSDYMIRNYDNDPQSYEGRYVIYRPIDGGYTTVGPSMQITGRTDGMNEKGLALGYNFVNRKKSSSGFVCNMIGRIILERCANVDEAILLLKELPHRHSFNYSLLDQSGETFVVEASPRDVVVRKSNICTNHFELLTEENRYRMDDSIRRYNRLKAQQHSESSLQAFQVMNDVERGVFSTNYGAWSGTIHTAIYYPKTLKAGITLGGNKLPFIFALKRLETERINIKRMKGQLAAKHPFVNMED